MILQISEIHIFILDEYESLKFDDTRINFNLLF